MFCPKCGTKQDEGAKFCKKCGQAISEDKKNSEPVPAVVKNPPAGCNRGCAWGILITLLIVYLGILIIDYGQIKSSTESKIVFYIFGAFFVFIFGWALFKPKRKEATHDSYEKPWKKIIISGVGIIISIAVTLGLVVFVFYFFKNIKINPSNTEVQNNTTATTKSGNTKTAKDWDGYYPAQMTKPNCDSTVELTAFSVTEGKVVNLYGNNAAIGTDNKATMTMNYSRGMTVHFTFSTSGGRNVISGSWTSGSCSGTFTAQSSF